MVVEVTSGRLGGVWSRSRASEAFPFCSITDSKDYTPVSAKSARLSHFCRLQSSEDIRQEFGTFWGLRAFDTRRISHISDKTLGESSPSRQTGCQAEELSKRNHQAENWWIGYEPFFFELFALQQTLQKCCRKN